MSSGKTDTRGRCTRAAIRPTEYEAVRNATGIWDLYSTCKYEVTGPDAARLIQRRFTNAVDGMQAGSVRYGAFVNADGLMIDDGNVYKLADDHFLVMINTAGIDDWFRETADGLDAQIAHRTDDYAMIAVQGPTSQETLQAADRPGSRRPRSTSGSGPRRPASPGSTRGCSAPGSAARRATRSSWPPATRSGSGTR